MQKRNLLFLAITMVFLSGCGSLIHSDNDSGGTAVSGDVQGKNLENGTGNALTGAGTSGDIDMKGTGNPPDGTGDTDTTAGGTPEGGNTDNEDGADHNNDNNNTQNGTEGTIYHKLSDTLYINDAGDVLIYIDRDLNKSAKLIYDTPKIKEITHKIYQNFKDSFDFIFLVTNNKEHPESVTYAGVFSKIKNDVEGIGASLYDNTADYGSNGKLMGVMHFAYRRAILSGPTLHEISHYWANKFHFDENGANGYRLGSGSHWGYNGFFGGRGQLGGYDATTLKDENAAFTSKKGKEWRLYSAASFGWNANGGNGLPYNDVELYLMGMLSKDKVKDMMISKPWGSPTWPAANTYITDHNLSTAGRKYFMAQEVVRKSWSSILSEHNVPDRNPDVTASPKHFRILTVLLDTRMPATYEVHAISRQMQSLAYKGDDGNGRNYNFYEATRGVGSLSVSGLKDEVKGSSEEVLVEPAFVSQSLTWKGFAYKTVKSPYTGRIWLDRNLGATRVCQSFDDTACYGDLFAFGRGFDGHQKRNSPITQQRFDSLTPDSDAFVVVGNASLVDWVSAGVDDELSERHAFVTDSSGSGICPAGFRLPTIDELSAETVKNEVRDPFPGDHIAQNFLKLPMSGMRLSQTDRTYLYGGGMQGAYWSSSVSDGKVRHMLFGDDSTTTYFSRYMSNAEAIRCIKAER